MKVTSKICMTKDVGTNGNLFGGNMLAWMDEAAAIFAQQITGRNVVSVRFAEIIFKKPVRQDDIIEFYCEKIKQGHTSVTFDIFAVVKDRETHEGDVKNLYDQGCRYQRQSFWRQHAGMDG